VAIQNIGNNAGAIEGSSAAPGTAQVGASAGAGGGNTPALSADMEALKKELESRAQIIGELQSQVSKAREANNTGELLEKIKNLEGKLSEYEIIEDDIADLSNFKEENIRLQKELEALKRGGPQLVDQFADALTAKPMEAVATAATPTAEEKTADVLSDVVAQAQAQAGELGIDMGTDTSTPGEEILDFAAPAPTASGATAAPEVAAPATPAAPVEAKADIFGEFSGDSPNEEVDPLAALGDIDPDKMLDELKDLNADLSMGSEALDEAPDIDKMAQEAESLEKKS
jgi:hypothetical protein